MIYAVWDPFNILPIRQFESISKEVLVLGNKLTNASNEAAATTKLHEPKPYFIFGDFNFRLDGKSVVKNLTSDLLDVTKPENGAENKQYVDRRSQELVLSIGKKEFALLRGDNTFR